MRKNFIFFLDNWKKRCIFAVQTTNKNNNLKTNKMETNRNHEIATTIISQIGGNKFAVMTGAKNFTVIENGVRFTIGKNATKSNCVKIILKDDDTYTMQFWHISKDVNIFALTIKYVEKGMTNEQVNAKIAEAQKKAEPKMLKEYNGLFFDQLQEFFTEYTKMYTRL